MRRMLVLAVGALVLAAACGESEPPDLAQSGLRTTEPEATTTTEADESEDPDATEAATTTTSFAVAVTPVPDMGSVEPPWTGEVIDPATGQPNIREFNRYLLDESPALIAPEEAVTVFLGLDPDDEADQMLVGPAGGPEAERVVVVQLVEGDDATRAIRWEFVVERRDRLAMLRSDAGAAPAAGGGQADGDEAGAEEAAGGEEAGGGQEGQEGEGEATREIIPWFVSGALTSQCQPGRGHQDFTVAPCP